MIAFLPASLSLTFLLCFSLISLLSFPLSSSFSSQSSFTLLLHQGVSLGDNVTLRCHLPRLAARVWLYREGDWSYNKGKKKDQDAAEFSFVGTLQEHAGRYRCQYWVSESAEVSVKSDPVELVLTGEDTGDTPHLHAPPVMDGWLCVCIQSAWGLWLAIGTPKLPYPTGAEEQSRANLVMALVRGFVAALVFGLGVFFVIDARNLWIRRDDNCGEQV
uniref:Immunoglobulin domain-containing protein n=1 Tax=Gallus gallus TaxID=9031 RepID=A0A8V0XQQ7_CHICK